MTTIIAPAYYGHRSPASARAAALAYTRATGRACRVYDGRATDYAYSVAGGRIAIHASGPDGQAWHTRYAATAGAVGAAT